MLFRSYTYEVYRDQVLSQLVASASGRPAGIGTSQWVVNVNLLEDTTYYWRARAVDPDNVAGDWSSVGQFFVTTVNSAPQPPVIIAPQNGTLVTTLRPELITLNANDHGLLVRRGNAWGDLAARERRGLLDHRRGVGGGRREGEQQGGEGGGVTRHGQVSSSLSLLSSSCGRSCGSPTMRVRR